MEMAKSTHPHSDAPCCTCFYKTNKTYKKIEKRRFSLSLILTHSLRFFLCYFIFFPTVCLMMMLLVVHHVSEETDVDCWLSDTTQSQIIFRHLHILPKFNFKWNKNLIESISCKFCCFIHFKLNLGCESCVKLLWLWCSSPSRRSHTISETSSHIHQI